MLPAGHYYGQRSQERRVVSLASVGPADRLQIPL